MSERRTDDSTLIAALRILARDIESGDGVANAAIAEAADRLQELADERRWIPVGERLPELNDDNHHTAYCLAACKNGPVCEMRYEINTYAKAERHRKPRWKWHGAISHWHVTHWRPLPPGPPGGQCPKRRPQQDD